jgi:hypothetical protein
MVRFLPEARNIFVRDNLQTDLLSIQLFIEWGSEPVSLGLKRRGCEADQLPSSVAEVKNEWNHTTFPIRLHSILRII